MPGELGSTHENRTLPNIRRPLPYAMPQREGPAVPSQGSTSGLPAQTLDTVNRDLRKRGTTTKFGLC